MSRDARLMAGLALILVPTIVYGGLTLLGVLSGGAYGMPAPLGLTPLQQSLYRAGHAHAGVLTILGVLLQALIDHSSIWPWLVWPLRVGALAASLMVAAGFFGVAHIAGSPRTPLRRCRNHDDHYADGRHRTIARPLATRH